MSNIVNERRSGEGWSVITNDPFWPELDRDVSPSFPETHRQGTIEIVNLNMIKGILLEEGRMLIAHPEGGFYANGDLGVQIAEDGRVWVCIDGIALLRFKPKRS